MPFSKLRKCIDENSNLTEQMLKHSHIDKHELKLEHSLIQGFDGGLYLLLNTVQDLSILTSGGVSEDYLS